MDTLKWNGREVEILPSLPPGWKILQGATHKPHGYIWVYNGKSLFSGEYKSSLIKE